MNSESTSSGTTISLVTLNDDQQHQNENENQDHTIVSIIPTPIPSSPLPPTPTPTPTSTPAPSFPCLDLFDGPRKNYIRVGVPLYAAAMTGDWKAAKPFLDQQPDLIRFAISENYETVLHIAAAAESTESVQEFVINLVDLMDPCDLELQNRNGYTALALAASAGNVKAAMIMVNKCPGVIDIPSNSRIMPLYMAALFARHDMVRYLYGLSKEMNGEFWSTDNRGFVLQKCVEADIYDIAIKIINDRPELIVKKGLISDLLVDLARKTHALKGTKPYVTHKIIKSAGSREKGSEALQFLRIIWGKIATMLKTDIDDVLRGPPQTVGNTKSYPSRLLFLATKMGNTQFIIELIRSYPDLLWKQDDKGKTIFHLAVKRREAEIYNLLYEIGAIRDLITPVKDIKGNNMLHMVAKSTKQTHFQNMAGAALQMQRELLWFKEVAQMIPPQYRQRKNKAGETPQSLFAKKHRALISKGEGWMKNYMVVATLIATIVFAAAFTLPGGYNQNTGIPFFRKKPSLIIFVIADAIALISSSTSVLIFLSILTSGYTELDLLESLPEKLMFGVTTLFLSIVTMMVSFSASFFVLYNEKLEWVPITVTCLAGMPILLFVKMQFRLLTDVFYSAYRSRSLFKPKRRILFI